MPDQELEQSHSPKAAALSARGKNEMIDHRHVDRLAGARQRARRAAISGARGWIAARMVMSKHDTRTAEARGIGNDRSYRQGDGLAPAIVAAEMDAACPVIEMSDPQLLGRLNAVVETGGEKGLRGRMPGQDRGRLRTFDLHAGTLSVARATSHFNRVRFGGDTIDRGGWTRGRGRLG